MRAYKEARLDGPFLGWNPKVTYRLTDGSKWMLSRARSSQCNRFRPAARIWRFQRKYYLEIVELGEFAEVNQLN